jgi:ketosteroid isomerase-like protein
MSEQNLEIARRGYAAFRRGGVTAMLEFLDPEIEWRTWEEFARERRVLHGHEGVREMFSIYEENFDQLDAEPLDFIDAGDKVVVPFRLRGRAKGSGDELDVELVHVWTTGGERAKRLEVYSSRSDALAAVGIKPE